MRRTAILLAAVSFSLLFHLAPARAGTVYLTADDLNGTNLFGTVDIATGQFTQVTATSQLFLALTAGPGGQVFGADANSGNLFTISPSGVATQFGNVTAPDAFYGLAYSTSAGKFFADNLNSSNVTLYSIAGNGNSSSLVGTLAGPMSGLFPTGNLVFGPGGKLYFDFLPTSSMESVLYSVNTSNGALTQVGGLGTDILSLFSDGNTLYGIDADTTSNTGIYTINTSTGLATQISTLTGLPTGDFFVDAATFATPETGSSLGLMFLALGSLIAATRLRRA